MILDVRELVRRVRAGQTDRAIARELGVARKTVTKYRGVAARANLLEGPLPSAGELKARLDGILLPSPPPRPAFKAAIHRERIQAWRKDGVGPRPIFERLRDEHGYAGSYASVYRYVIHLEGDTPGGIVRIEVSPGEEAQVDFGYAGLMVDPQTGEERKAWVFVMTLSHSRHQYATFVFDQKVETWLRCHREAFEHFGGVPRKIVVDNLKSAIVKAVLHEPVAQRSYREFAEHYDFLISPCRPRTPQHKGKVESGVKYVKRNFLAGRRFRDITEANAKLLEWVERIAGTRIHGTTKERPLARFLEVEREALVPLPTVAYDMGVWKQAKLHPDCHVVIDGAYYSAPHRLIGQRLWVRTNGRDVLLFHDYDRVASHAWGRPGTRRTLRDHYPPEKVAYLMATPQYCLNRAETIGDAAATVVGRLLAERPLDRLRTVQAILRMGEKYGPRRLEAACRRGLCFDDTSYTTLKRILQRGLETQPVTEFESPAPPKTDYVFARPGSEIFLEEGDKDHGRNLAVDPQAQGPAALGRVGHPGRA
jgi:transposase